MAFIEQYLREQAAFQEFLKDMNDDVLLSKGTLTSVKICRAGEIAYKLKSSSYPNTDEIKSALINWLITDDSDKAASEAMNKRLDELSVVLDKAHDDEDPVSNEAEVPTEKKGMSEELKQKLKEGREKYHAERKAAKAKAEEEKRQAIMVEVEKNMKKTEKAAKKDEKQKGGGKPVDDKNVESAKKVDKPTAGKKGDKLVIDKKEEPAKKEEKPAGKKGDKPVVDKKAEPAKKDDKPVDKTVDKPTVGKKDDKPVDDKKVEPSKEQKKPVDKPSAGKKGDKPIDEIKPKQEKKSDKPDSEPYKKEEKPLDKPTAGKKAEKKEEEQEAKKNKKDAIPKILKDLCWYTWVGKTVASHTCLCCERMEIRMNSFECGHVLAEAKGGQLSVDNLRPICGGCNRSMGSENLEDFKRRCGFGDLVKSPCELKDDDKPKAKKATNNEGATTINVPNLVTKGLVEDISSPKKKAAKNTEATEPTTDKPKSEFPIAPPLHERRKTIAGGIKRQVWDKHVGADLAKSKCPCCKHNQIDVNTFVCAHFKGEGEGGRLEVDNLRPICITCDADIGTQSINEFMKMYNIV